jgi:hypothetical protein
MKKKTIILIASAVLVGTATAMGIAKRAKDKKEGAGTGDGTNGGGGTGGGGGTTDPCGSRAKDTSAYGLKVMALQERVGITGCDKDGLVGSQTNGAVKAKYPTLFATLGNVTPANIDSYLAGKVTGREILMTTAESLVNAVNNNNKKLLVVDGNFPFTLVTQAVKLPNSNEFAASSLRTYIKTKVNFGKGEVYLDKDKLHIILEIEPSDIYAGNTYYSYVRILPKYLMIDPLF